MSGDEEETHGFMDVMPDPIEAAFQKIVENAEANCPFDTYRPWVIEDVGANRIVNTMNDCTCDATIDAAARLASAALYERHKRVVGNAAAGEYGEPNYELKVDAEIEATINRLREEAKK